MLLDAGCEITYELTEPTPLFLLLRPQSGGSQQVLTESLTLTPAVPVFSYSDSFGNACQRCEAPAGRLEIVSQAQVEVSPMIDVHPGHPTPPYWNCPPRSLNF